MDKLPGSPPIPPNLEAEYSAWAWEVAYQYGPDGLTYRLLGPSGEVRFVKLARIGGYPNLEDEAVRMIWASKFLPVPRVLSEGVAEGTGWLVSEGLPGKDATHPSLTDDPRALVSILARGLRRFHDAPVDLCPFDFRLGTAIAHVGIRLAEAKIDPVRDFHEEFLHLSAAEAVSILERTRPPGEDLVVCHGDYCLPNILVDGGEASGFVDLGELGVADRWWDLSVASWSLTWNLGPGFEGLFFEEYGIDPDPSRITFYRLLYDLVS